MENGNVKVDAVERHLAVGLGEDRLCDQLRNGELGFSVHAITIWMNERMIPIGDE